MEKTNSLRSWAGAGSGLAVVLFLLGAPAGSLTGQNLLTNGDFGQPLENGWSVSSTDSLPKVELSSDSPASVRVRHSANGSTLLSQQVPVPDGNLKFAFTGWFSAAVNKPDFGSAAAVTVSYLGSDSSLLGRTAFARVKGKSALAGQGALHTIPVKADSQWTDFRLDVARELKANFPEVELDQVRCVEVALRADNGKDPGC